MREYEISSTKIQFTTFNELIKVEDLLQKLVSGQGDLSAALSGKIDICTLDTVSDLHVEKEILVLDVLKKFFSLGEILRCVLGNKKY